MKAEHAWDTKDSGAAKEVKIGTLKTMDVHVSKLENNWHALSIATILHVLTHVPTQTD